MALIKHHKIVSALPAQLEADAMYFVRKGEGFEVHLTNSTGIVVAYPANYVTNADARMTKLDGIQAGAQVNTVTSVAGRTGVVTLAKADVELNNVDNTSDANKPVSTAQQTALNLKANLASPTFTGTPRVPTPASSTNSTQIASTAFVQAVVAALVNGAPGALNELNELAAAMGNDPDFATTMINALALKAPLASPELTGNPTAPTQAATDNDTSIATTAFVRAAMGLFGVGASTASSLETAENWIGQRFKGWNSAAPGAPSASTAAVGFDLGYGANRRFQAAITGEQDFKFRYTIDPTVADSWRTVWHTGNLVKQASPADTTAGALMAVGAFGLGREVHPGSVYITDADALLATGDYAVGATWVGSPTPGTAGSNQGSLRHIANFQTTAYAKQEWTSLNLTVQRSMIRNKVNGVWGPWREVFHTGNILGTVSQSGGVPTGAIIERGSNANGEYVRFADGTQWCWHRVTKAALPISTAMSGGFRTAGQAWTFPAVFAGTPRVTPTAIDMTAFGAAAWGVLPDSAGFIFTSVTSQAAADRIVDLVAVGRWSN